MDTIASSPKSAITSDDELISWWIVTKESICIWFIGMYILSGAISIGFETDVKGGDVKELDICKSSFSQILIETEGMSSTKN